MLKPSCNVIKRDGLECCCQCRVQLFRRARLASTDQRLDLQPTVLNRRQVRRVGRQPQHLRLGVGHCCFNLAGLLHWQIIQQHNIFRAQLRHPPFADRRITAERIDRPFETQWREHAAQTQTPDQRHPGAVIARYALVDSCATHRTSRGPRHRQMKASFVGEDEPATVQSGDFATQSLAVGFDPLRSREALFSEAHQASVAHGRESRDELQLWLFFSSVPTVPQVRRLVALRLGSATASVTFHSTLPDSLRRAAVGRGSGPLRTASATWQQCGGQRRISQPLDPTSHCRAHMPRQSCRASPLNKPSCEMNGLTCSANASANRNRRQTTQTMSDFELCLHENKR